MEGQVSRVVHVAAGLDPAQGGPSYSVPSLAAAQKAAGCHVSIRAVGDLARGDGTVIDYARSNGVLGKLGRASPSLSLAVKADAQAGTMLHAHGLWLFPNLYPALERRRYGGECKLVHSPRGMLAPDAMAISAWKKVPIWLLWQRAALVAADCLHATAPSERDEIRLAGFRNPIAVIPNGMDLPTLSPKMATDTRDRVLLFFGRIHPKKGLDRLLRAWRTIQNDFQDWRLEIVGPSERGHDRELMALAVQLGAGRVSFYGPAYGEEKWQFYQRADLFVLPTLNENFGLAVAEALACNLPVISTRGAPWSGLEVERCGWWIDHGVEPLSQALREAMSMPSAVRRAMGLRGRDWIARDFGWDRIARDMLSVYQWLRSGGDRPAFVYND